MTKVVFTKLNPRGRQRHHSVKRTRVRAADGSMQTIRVIDVNSNTLGADLQYVFNKNIEEARRENERIIGVPDIEPKD